MPSPKLQSLYPMYTAAGDLELLGLDSAGTVWRNVRSGGSWHTWQPNFRDARPKVSLATVEGNEDGRTYVFGLDGVGTVWRLAHIDGTWRNWELPSNAPQLASIAGAGLNADDNTDVFGVGKDGTLWHLALIGDTWYGWERDFPRNAPKLASVEIVGRNADENTDVFGVGLDGTLWHLALIGGERWYDWEPNFPGNAPKLASVTCVGQNDDDNTDVFGVGLDGTLWHLALIDEHWYDWEPDFDQAPKVSSVEATQGHHTEVFVVGLDGMLLGNHLSAGGWHQWEPNFQGAPKDIASVRATSQGEAVTDLFALRTDGSLIHDILSRESGAYRWCGWSTELQVPGSTSPSPSGMFTVMLTQDRDHPSQYVGRPLAIHEAPHGVIDGEITASGSYLDPDVQRDRFMGISLHTQNGTFETSVRDRVPTDFFDGKPVNGLWTAIVGGHLPGLPSSVYIHGEYRSSSALISVATPRVTWVTADDTSDYDRCINALGGDDDGTAWSLSLFEAIAAHEAGQEFYVTNVNGEKVPLVLATSRAGRKYLRTKHDSERPDNLLALPRR